MKCPFLRESWVKFCQATPYKKVIEQTADSSADLCTSSAFCGCAVLREQRLSPASPSCPFLHESRGQVCSQDPTVRFVPCSDQVLARCVTENHRYCEIYLDATHHPLPAHKTCGASPADIPPGFFVTRNHMWLDISTECDCHIGMDALLTRLLGRIEKLSFVTTEGEQRPSVLITIRGEKVHLVFPNPMRITSPNAQARVAPERVFYDPYGAGWLFEGTEPPGTEIRHGLLSGEQAQLWMEHEVQRATEMILRRTSEVRERPLAADGGSLVPGILRQLKRNQILQFFDELFKNEEAL